MLLSISRISADGEHQENTSVQMEKRDCVFNNINTPSELKLKNGDTYELVCTVDADTNNGTIIINKNGNFLLTAMFTLESKFLSIFAIGEDCCLEVHLSHDSVEF